MQCTKHAKTMSTVTVELTIKVKNKFTSSNAENNQWIHLTTDVANFHTSSCVQTRIVVLECLETKSREYTTTNKLELLDGLYSNGYSRCPLHWVDLGEDETGQLTAPMNAVAKTLEWQGRTLDLSEAYKQVPQAMCVLGYFHKVNGSLYNLEIAFRSHFNRTYLQQDKQINTPYTLPFPCGMHVL